MVHYFFSFCPLVIRPVDKTLCVGPAPAASQLCSIPCSTDCVVSSWSAWGLCIHENCHDLQGRKGEWLVSVCVSVASSVHMFILEAL